MEKEIMTFEKVRELFQVVALTEENIKQLLLTVEEIRKELEETLEQEVEERR